jgi:predicted nucleic acid-binding protein
MTKLPLSARRVLVDTSAFYALTDPRDENHTTAAALRNHLIAERWRLFTTELILAETHALLLARLGRSTALQLLQAIEASPTTILPATPADHRRARAILSQYDDKEFSLTDAISFAVMERLGISYAFTFDRDFTQYGFTVLTPEQF